MSSFLLIEIISDAIARKKLAMLTVHGNDYDTVDGTGVRDYVHVVDLAEAHVQVLEKANGLTVYNVGTGHGTSVLELVSAFIEQTKLAVPFQIGERRAGDVATCFAGVDKIKKELGWEAKHTIADMVRDAWNFEMNQFTMFE